jgi:hypothetical protein
MVFGLCRPKLEDVLDGDDLQANARSSTPSPPSSPKLGAVPARATSAPTSRRGRNLRRVAPAEPPIAATVSAVVAIHDSGSPPAVAPVPPRTIPVPEVLASAAANGGLKENAEETRGPLGPLPSQPINRRLVQKSKPFWELEKGRAPLGKISGRGTVPALLSEDSPPCMSPAAGPPNTGGVGEAHAGAKRMSARSSSEWAVEEFDDGFPSPARPTGNGLQRPAPMPLSALSASAAAQRAPLAPLAPSKRLVTPAAPPSDPASLASLSELPPLPQQRQPSGARTALPDPKTLPSALGSVHGGTRHPAAAPAANPTAAPPAAAPPSSGACVPAGKSALKGSSSGQGKPAEPGRRLRWTPGEVQRVVVVARPEIAQLAEAKADYKRNLQAISQLRRQHAHGACGKCRLGSATAHTALASWGGLARLLVALRTRGPMAGGLQCGREAWPQGAHLAASNTQAHGTPFRELVRALDRAEGGEALASLPGRGGFPHELEGASRTWGQIITPPAVAAGLAF